MSPGRLPIYLIPDLLLERLGYRAACAGGPCPWHRPERLRPFRDRALLVAATGPGERLCRIDEPGTPCRAALDELRAWQVELLELVEGPAIAQPTPTSC